MRVYSLFQNELHAKRVEVEFHSRFQIPSFHILGLPAPEIQEARERIMAAFSASQLEFPKKKVMVNLTPSAERKSGTGYDLAISLKILESVLDQNWPEELYAWGELGLDGSIKPCRHLAKWIELLNSECQEAKTERTLLLPEEDFHHFLQLLQWRKDQGLLIPLKLNLVSIAHLTDFKSRFPQGKTIEQLLSKPTSASPLPNFTSSTLLPLSPLMERALSLAMVGRHHLLILGPKGHG